MMAERLSWPRRLQTRLQREAAFLPKRLVLVALLLLALYLALLFRMEYSALYTRLGFVEASLKSKLIADYAGVERPVIPFAPLRLEIIKAKIQDENPYLSEHEIAALVQIAAAAADAPIVRATPTPLSNVPATVNAAVVISANLLLEPHALADTSTSLVSQRTPRAVISAPAVVMGTGANPAFQLPNDVLDQLKDVHPLTMPVATVGMMPTWSPPSPTPTPSSPNTAVALALKLDVSLTGGDGTTPMPQRVPSTPGLATPTGSPPATLMPNDTMISVTHLAASQPILRDTSPATPTPTASAVVIIATIMPSATWTPWPTHPPGLRWTATPTPTLPLPTVTQNPTVTGVQVSATPLALPPATAMATATTTAVPTAVPTVALTSTPLPPVAVPQLPTPTLPPTLTATATTVIPPTLTPTLTAFPLVDHLTAYVQGDKVYLEWPTALNVGIVGYNLYRQDITNGSGERINRAPIQNTSYVDTVALDGRQYLYRVTMIDQLTQESPPSQAVTVTVADRLPPQIPGHVWAQLVGVQVQLAWDANVETDFIGYNIYRDTQSPVGHALGPLNGATLVTQPVYVDTILANGQTYYYRLTAVDATGNESAPSPEVQIATHHRTAPAAPGGLTAVFEDDDDHDDDEDNEDEITLKWQANQEADVIGYRLYRSTTLPVDTTVAPLHPKSLLTTLRYKDEDLARDITYYYVVVAVDQEQNVSPPSAPVAVVVPK